MGGAIEACSKRQVSTAIDTVGAELFVASTYAAVAIGLVNVLRFVSLLWRTRTPTSADVLRQRGMPTHLQRCDIDQESVIRHIWRAGRRLCVSSPSHLTRSCADAQGGRHSRAQPTRRTRSPNTSQSQPSSHMLARSTSTMSTRITSDTDDRTPRLAVRAMLHCKAKGSP